MELFIYHCPFYSIWLLFFKKPISNISIVYNIYIYIYIHCYYYHDYYDSYFFEYIILNFIYIHIFVTSIRWSQRPMSVAKLMATAPGVARKATISCTRSLQRCAEWRRKNGRHSVKGHISSHNYMKIIYAKMGQVWFLWQIFIYVLFMFYLFIIHLFIYLCIHLLSDLKCIYIYKYNHYGSKHFLSTANPPSYTTIKLSSKVRGPVGSNSMISMINIIWKPVLTWYDFMMIWIKSHNMI